MTINHFSNDLLSVHELLGRVGRVPPQKSLCSVPGIPRSQIICASLCSAKVVKQLLGLFANVCRLNFYALIGHTGVQYVPRNSVKVHRRASRTAWRLAVHYVATVNTQTGYRHALLHALQAAGSPRTHKVGFIWNTQTNDIIPLFCCVGSHLKWVLSSVFCVVSWPTRLSQWTTKWSLAGWSTS